VPTLLGGNGIEKVIELDLTPEEKAALDKSAESVRNVMAVMVLLLTILMFYSGWI
jgi:malate dehydrogenase